MKIGQQKTRPAPSLSANAAKRRLMWTGAVVLAFVAGWVVPATLAGGDRGWHQVLAHRWSSLVWRLESGGTAEDLPTLVVDMDFANYDALLEQRERALQSGVVLSSSRSFVQATVRIDGITLPVGVRLLEGPARNLGADDKWEFEVRTEDDVPILGMCRFYLQDPASNNWLNQWAFAQSLRREDILAARYQFVRLIFNGRERGIYALQEGFARGVLEAQGRPRGVVAEFDADLLWESISHFQGDVQAAYADPVTNLSASDIQYLEIDTFRDVDIADDLSLVAQRDRAVELLHILQVGQRPASEVFDVEQYGRFLALVDLWGATEGASLINLKYYYSAGSDRLEPIAFDANALGSQARLSLATTYGDPRLQSAYVQEAARVSQPEYLDQLQAELEAPWRRLAAAVRWESGDLAPPWEALRRRQENLRRSLNPVQPVFAYLATFSSMSSLAHYDVLRVGVGNVLNLPIEIVGFDIGGATYLPADPTWIRGAPTGLTMDGVDGVVLKPLDATRSPVVRYVEFDIPLTVIHSLDRELEFNREPDVYVEARVWGSPVSRLTLARYGLPALADRGGSDAEESAE